MKLFRIFAVGLILSAVVVATAIAPLTSAVGPTSDPPNADVVPNFSGLNVSGNSEFEGDVVIDGNNDGTDDFVVESGDGYVEVNNLFYVDANDDGNPEFSALDFNIATIGKYSDGAYLAIENLLGSILLNATTGSGTVTIQANDININGPTNVSGTLTATQVGSYYQIYRKATTSNYTYVSCYAGDFLTSCNGKANAGSLRYAYPTNNICQVSSTSSAGSIYARAICFDPHGTYSGLIDADDI